MPRDKKPVRFYQVVLSHQRSISSPPLEYSSRKPDDLVALDPYSFRCSCVPEWSLYCILYVNSSGNVYNYRTVISLLNRILNVLVQTTVICKLRHCVIILVPASHAPLPPLHVPDQSSINHPSPTRSSSSSSSISPVISISPHPTLDPPDISHFSPPLLHLPLEDHHILLSLLLLQHQLPLAQQRLLPF